MTNPSSRSAVPVRLLSSVAVVGRDNEPIYLRGDLCDVLDRAPADASAHRHDARHAVEDHDDHDHDDDQSPTSQRRRGFLGRMKDAVVRNTDEYADDSDEDDPFGFFDEPNAPSSMSLTQQLVLHASLDRFEEATVRTGSSAGRWRMPGASGPNAMWMGLLCEVEERWNVYGTFRSEEDFGILSEERPRLKHDDACLRYLTNTGIKFMIIVENVMLDEEGIRQNEHASSSPSSNSSFLDPLPSASSSNREADLKHIFSRLHELYVQYTLNPFSKLRGPIRSRAFDGGILEMARSFNEKAMRMAGEETTVASLEESLSWM
ncbi:hypothetical protein ACHAW6_015324 [Cyclotella cf. meneghiniana]